MAKKLGIEDRLLINYLNPKGDALSDRQLNRLYNACDVGINTAMGEGWGLPSFEHAATGAAQIVPGHTSLLENWSGAADFLPVVAESFLAYEHARMFVVDERDVAAKLSTLYEDETYLGNMSRKAYRHASSERFHWARISKQLFRLFEKHANPWPHAALAPEKANQTIQSVI